MLEREVRIINPLGLHARAAAKLVRLARTFQSRISIEHRTANATANAKSMLSILAIAAGKDSILVIVTDGPDEDAAMVAVGDLVGSGFGEI
ncbi:MAG: phosphotransferase System HPr (HPr) Family protein [Acidobacteria bacterium OLB17]|nr:MAG: phosphotransferase System HPr (HPr) Family protein [Acidobacteria bacterium OLB17]MCZ2392085.1 HPr family phosphocarrier protein [Acidobacteriota bacterium]